MLALNAYALTGGTINLAPIVVGAQIRGVQHRLVATGRPADVAQAVRFFATCSDYVTGQIIEVNGGLLMP